jgi:hypothetical protein
LANRRGNLRTHYSPEEAKRLARALKRGIATMNQRNDYPDRLFRDLEARNFLSIVIAMCEAGRGLSVIPVRSYR